MANTDEMAQLQSLPSLKTERKMDENEDSIHRILLEPTETGTNSNPHKWLVPKLRKKLLTDQKETQILTNKDLTMINKDQTLTKKDLTMINKD
jgi:hypothetical protein